MEVPTRLTHQRGGRQGDASPIQGGRGTRPSDLTLSGNVICVNETDVELVGGAELTDMTGNRICADASG